MPWIPVRTYNKSRHIDTPPTPPTPRESRIENAKRTQIALSHSLSALALRTRSSHSVAAPRASAVLLRAGERHRFTT